MSYTSLTTASRDQSLNNRVAACGVQEAYENPAVANTPFAQRAKSQPSLAAGELIWPVCLATEAEYESALAADNPDPGGDPAVITDGMILSAVQANWPQS